MPTQDYQQKSTVLPTSLRTTIGPYTIGLGGAVYRTNGHISSTPCGIHLGYVSGDELIKRAEYIPNGEFSVPATEVLKTLALRLLDQPADSGMSHAVFIPHDQNPNEPRTVRITPQILEHRVLVI